MDKASKISVDPSQATRRNIRMFLLQLSIFAMFQAGSYFSLFAHRDISVSDYYIPTALSIILVNWFSPRLVLPAMYVNAVVTSYAWGNPIENFPLWFVYAIPETLYPLLSWVLFRKFYGGKPWIPDVKNLILFLGAGVLVPAIIETFMLQTTLLLTGALAAGTYWTYITSNLLSEFVTTFILTLPVLYFVTPVLHRTGFITMEGYQEVPRTHLATREVIEVVLVFTGLLLLSLFLNFVRYWYIYGFFSLYIAIRFGFGLATATNLYIILLTYIIPNFITPFGKNSVDSVEESIEIFLGANFLFVFAAITGRVIADVRKVEKELKDQNEMLARTNQALEKTNTELEVANKELDRFAYSVSHDLSAPLKTVLGLVALSKIKDNPDDNKLYLDRIGKSATKLETFITEVLDHSKNKRQELIPEEIDLKTLVEDIVNTLVNFSLERPVKLHLDLEHPVILHDKSRLKLILNNLLSNAVRFQRTHVEHCPYIKVSSRTEGEDFVIEVEDNGEGIPGEIQGLIFEMFYRGNLKSQGSGLGLYIAKEAAAKLNGTIGVYSRFGLGSTFTVRIPLIGNK